MKNRVIFACLAIALLEGFAGLGIEIYAIRISATYIGSSTSITGVILAMVLLAIAAGYWYGGKLSQNVNTPRAALLKAGNVLALSAVCHTIACIIQLPLLDVMTTLIPNPIVSAVGVGLLFGAGLAFGSTSIPLITQFLTLQYEDDNHVDAGKNAGMMVAVTTVGSVLGSTVTPMILLPYIGLMTSLALFIATLALSAILCTLLAVRVSLKKEQHIDAFRNYTIAGFSVLVVLGFIVTNKTDTGYQTATTAWFVDELVYKGEPAVSITDYPIHIISSCWLPKTKRSCTWYGEEVVKNIRHTNSQKLAFLGGAGMAIPSEVAVRNESLDITVVDIDKALPAIVEAHFLKEPIAKNIRFIGDDARGYFNRNNEERYDFLLLDAFAGSFVAGNLYTTEALAGFKRSSTHVMANVIGSTAKSHTYTQILLKNWHEVFGGDSYVVTRGNQEGIQNILLCNFACVDSTKLTAASYFNKNAQTHTDDMPRLDRFYYKAI